MAFDLLVKLLSGVGTAFSASLIQCILEHTSITVDQDANEWTQILGMSDMFTVPHEEHDRYLQSCAGQSVRREKLHQLYLATSDETRSRSRSRCTSVGT